VCPAITEEAAYVDAVMLQIVSMLFKKFALKINAEMRDSIAKLMLIAQKKHFAYKRHVKIRMPHVTHYLEQTVTTA